MVDDTLSPAIYQEGRTRRHKLAAHKNVLRPIRIWKV